VFSPGTRTILKTAATDEEIRSWLTIFRRLYMAREPANFLKAVDAFVTAIGDHPYAKWVAGIAAEYQALLDTDAGNESSLPSNTFGFSVKRLIDVYLYTEYAHQPNEARQKQFAECLSRVHGKRDVLTFMFLTATWRCCLEFLNAGRQIAYWFEAYCKNHGLKPEGMTSLHCHHPGVGSLEKDEDRRARLFDAKVQELAKELWQQAGSPESGIAHFVSSARQQLGEMLSR
jgi:hypothetical protein